MSDRATRLYVSNQEMLAKAAPDLPPKPSPAKPSRDNRLRLPAKLSKTDLTEKKAVSHTSNTRNAGRESEDANLPLQSGSPWRRYREILALLDLGDKVVVACERNTNAKCVIIRRYPRDDKEKERLSWFRNLRHANVVSVLQLFAGNKILYVVLEPMKLPIDHLIRCLWQLSAEEVGVIMGQVSRRDPAETRACPNFN